MTKLLSSSFSVKSHSKILELIAAVATFKQFHKGDELLGIGPDHSFYSIDAKRCC